MHPSLFELPAQNLYYKGDHEIQSLQVVKAVAAFGVVHIHTSAMPTPICRNAVPIFFMITGYFLLNNEGVLTFDKLKRTIIKILKLDVIAQVFYMLCLYIPQPNLLVVHEGNILKHLLQLLVIGNAYCNALWYLHAVVQALVVFYIALRFKLLKFIPLLALVGWCVSLVCGDYALFWRDTPIGLGFTRNFFTIGIPCIYIGMWIRRFEYKITLTANQLLLFTFLLYVLLYVESVFVLQRQQWGDIFLFTIPSVIVTFLWVLRTHEFNRSAWLSNIGKKYSLYIYVLHVFVLSIIPGPTIYVPILLWLEVSVLTLLLSIVLRKAFGGFGRCFLTT